MFLRKNKDVQEPPVERFVNCTHCGQQLRVSPNAFSVNCRHCNRRVCIEDHFITYHHTITNIETSGKVAIAPTGYVRAQMRVFDLDVQGEVCGNVTARGKVSVGAEGRVVGDITAERLEVKEGATLNGYLQIGPGAKAEPPDRTT